MNRKLMHCLLFTLVALPLGLPGRSAQASSSPFVGEIMWVPYTFAPRGWARCDGQIMAIAANTALFSLLGTQYGGDGKATYALPDVQGRVLVSEGQSSLGTYYFEGESSGEESVTLLSTEIPLHTHAVNVSANPGTATTPTNNYLGPATTGTQYGNAPTAALAYQALGFVGSSSPHNNMMPYTTLNCIIATQGIFPARP